MRLSNSGARRAAMSKTTFVYNGHEFQIERLIDLFTGKAAFKAHARGLTSLTFDSEREARIAAEKLIDEWTESSA
jgi:hypothetical protein